MLAFFAAAEADALRSGARHDGARILPIRQEQLQERLGERFRGLDTPLRVEWPDGRREALPARTPQTGTEAQACGCPVVAFDCTGLPDVVEHSVTGYLARPYEPEDLAEGIRWVLEDPERHARLSAAARERAVRLWSPEVVVPQYLEVYRAAIEHWKAG